MFNWFKSKVELKKDSSIMTSSDHKKGLKLGSEIIVPSNFELLVFHKGKHYETLASGKYKVDKQLFPKLIKKQQSNNAKIKHVKCVLHYVNQSAQSMKIKFKKQTYVVEFKVSNSIDFALLMLLYTYKIDNEYALNTLNDILCELLLHHKGDYKQVLPTSLTNYGIEIISFSPINSKSSIFNENSNDKESVASPTTPTNITTNTNSSIALENTNTATVQQGISLTTSNNQVNEIICPKCNHISKFKTTYCLRCGFKLE